MFRQRLLLFFIHPCIGARPLKQLQSGEPATTYFLHLSESQANCFTCLSRRQVLNTPSDLEFRTPISRSALTIARRRIGAGQIGCTLVPMIANGVKLGHYQTMILHIPLASETLNGVNMDG